MSNLLSEMRPELVSEWSDKNLPLTPDKITYGSNKVVWWKGACGHEWQTSVKARSSGENCPICSGARVIEGINDLATLKPELADEWSSKNNPLKPTMITIGSHKKVIWLDKYGHEWTATVKSRALNGTGCPYCAHNKVFEGFNDLATLFPEIAAEWSERNLPLLPTMVTPFTNRKVWWKCKDCGNEWYTLISTRSGGSQCPYCSGYTLLKGFNDLATTQPKIAAEWSEKNEPLKADEVNEKSRQNVWWRCQTCGNEWKAVVNTRVKGAACEKLAGEISEGYSVIRLKPSRKDWNEILCDKNTDRKKAIAETITIKVPEAEELVPMLCYEDIKQTSVEWLWFPYIPFGKLTIIQGNPGEGKTYFAMMLTAACTNRKLFPNMEDIEPFNVIYQTAEDGMGDTIKPRLIEAGADLSRVMVIDDTEEALTLSDDRIEKAVRQNRVRLVIIDPVQAFIGADVDMNRANEVRPVFRKLGMIAEKTGCAIVLIGHLNKSSGTQSTYRGLGSIDIMAAVRSLIFIGKVRKDPTTSVLIHEKSSLAPPGETMAFKLGDEEGFRWVGAYEISADELLDGKEGKATETKLERGRKLIRELLADKKEISIRELDEKAKEQGISGRTMRDVRSRMKNELEYQVNEKQENSIRLKE